MTAAMAAGVDQASEEVDRDGRIYDLAISALPDHQCQPGGTWSWPGRHRAAPGRGAAVRRLNHERVATDRLEAPLKASGRGRAPAHPGRAQERVFQAVSHDLRTPLASVLGISPHLQRGRGRLAEADTDDLLGRLIANARKLDRIITGLLDLDKLDRGIVELRRERVDLDRLVAGVVSEARDELLGTHLGQPELLSVQVLADAAKVERIVENLLANAARYTDPGTPIWVRVSQRDRGRCCVSTTPASRHPGRAAGVDLPAVRARPRRHHLDPRDGGRAGAGRPDRQPPRRPGLGRGPRRGGASFRVLLPGANGRG